MKDLSQVCSLTCQFSNKTFDVSVGNFIKSAELLSIC